MAASKPKLSALEEAVAATRDARAALRSLRHPSRSSSRARPRSHGRFS